MGRLQDQSLCQAGPRAQAIRMHPLTCSTNLSGAPAWFLASQLQLCLYCLLQSTLTSYSTGAWVLSSASSRD